MTWNILESGAFYWGRHAAAPEVPRPDRAADDRRRSGDESSIWKAEGSGIEDSQSVGRHRARRLGDARCRIECASDQHVGERLLRDVGRESPHVPGLFSGKGAIGLLGDAAAHRAEAADRTREADD